MGTDPDDNDVFYKNPIYYIQGHFSKLIKSGWNKRGSRVDGPAPKTSMLLVVMESPDVSKRVAVILNRYETEQYINYWDRDLKKEVQFSVPAKSITSIYYS